MDGAGAGVAHGGTERVVRRRLHLRRERRFTQMLRSPSGLPGLFRHLPGARRLLRSRDDGSPAQQDRLSCQHRAAWPHASGDGMKRLSLLGFGLLASVLAGCPIWSDGNNETNNGGSGCVGQICPGGCNSPADCPANSTCGSNNQCDPGDCTDSGCSAGFVCVVSPNLRHRELPAERLRRLRRERRGLHHRHRRDRHGWEDHRHRRERRGLHHGHRRHDGHRRHAPRRVLRPPGRLRVG